MKKKVLVAMSGGVDSSVVAALLLRRGYDVEGVTFLTRDTKSLQEDVVIEAKAVADRIGVRHHVLDARDAFNKDVIDRFVQDYKKGITPNPCILCNKRIKFGMLMDKVDELGFDAIATGHYARITYQDECYQIITAVDEQKDQTYVLYSLNQKQLGRVMLPLGDYTKAEVRDMAKDWGFFRHDKKESQDICFISDNDYQGFIAEQIGQGKVGEFIDVNRNVLGSHAGIVNYTIGQRKGLGISFGKPMYVINIDADNNSVMLGDEKHLFSASLIAKDMNIVCGSLPEKSIAVQAKIRYSARVQDATLTMIDKYNARIDFNRPQRAITPGQAVVCYDGDVVVGGGTIVKAIHDN